MESPSGKILHGCPSVGQGVYAGTSDEVMGAAPVSEVSGAVLADGCGSADSDVASDTPSEVIAEDGPLLVDSAELIGAVEVTGAVVEVTGAVVEEAGGVEVGPVGGALEDGVLDDGATVGVTGVVVVVDGDGFGFGSVDWPQPTTPEASPAKQRSFAPVDQRRRSRPEFAFTFA